MREHVCDVTLKFSDAELESAGRDAVLLKRRHPQFSYGVPGISLRAKFCKNETNEMNNERMNNIRVGMEMNTIGFGMKTKLSTYAASLGTWGLLVDHSSPAASISIRM